jgi:hypothetical protein
VVNVYLPPTSSLTRRGIAEAQATTLLAEVMDKLQPQLTTIICGDFNVRIGTRIPFLDHTHPPRIVEDLHVCARAPWFISFCELYNLYILNGIHSPAAFTCHTGRGESMVDYILCNKSYLQVKHTTQQEYKQTDHDLLFTHLPLTSIAPPTPPVTHSPRMDNTPTPANPAPPMTPASKNKDNVSQDA